MAKKTFEGNHRITFDREPDAPQSPSLIPEMTCDEATVPFDHLQGGDRIGLADLLMVMKHLASDDVAHAASCPFHQAESLDIARTRFAERMRGE